MLVITRGYFPPFVSAPCCQINPSTYPTEASKENAKLTGLHYKSFSDSRFKTKMPSMRTVALYDSLCCTFLSLPWPKKRRWQNKKNAPSLLQNHLLHDCNLAGLIITGNRWGISKFDKFPTI